MKYYITMHQTDPLLIHTLLDCNPACAACDISDSITCIECPDGFTGATCETGMDRSFKSCRYQHVINIILLLL